MKRESEAESGASPGTGAEGFPLERAQRALGSAPALDAEHTRRVARDLGLPAARLREVVAFHGELARKPGRASVCLGTSCFLHGGAACADALPDAKRVHCLGHCDRSPCAATAAGEVQGGCRPEDMAAIGSGDADPAARAAIRCEAPTPIITRNVGQADASSLEVARRLGVWQALEAALAGTPDAVLGEVEASGERGRGGAGYPTGAKWRAAARMKVDDKVVVANGDEGDPGSFVDRILLEDDPHSVLEGLALCAYAIGAHRAVVFVRSEYPRALERIRAAIAEAEANGLLGEGILGSAFSLRVEVTTGFGSYVAGEETALLETLEGRAGEVRLRPPYPVEAGLDGRPTVVNNVETLVAIPWIVARGAEAFHRLGTETSSGTKALCLNAGFARPGIVEVELGHSLRAVLEDANGGDLSSLEAVILGGPMGSLLFEDDWDVPLCYAALGERGVRMGHGGLVAVPRGTDWGALLRHWLGFMTRESCGKCLPCREGSRRARDAVERGAATAAGLDATLALIESTSLCGFGHGAPGPMRTLLARRGARVLESAE